MSDNVRTYEVIHETEYAYSAPAGNGHHLAHLRPRTTPWQEVLTYALEIEPEPTEMISRPDYFGNETCAFIIDRPHEMLNVTARSTVKVTDQALPDDISGLRWETALPSTPVGATGEPLEVTEARLGSSLAPRLPDALGYGRKSFPPGRPWLEAMLDLTLRIRTEFAYDPEATSISTPVSEVLAHRRGVCQDFAHLMLSCLRSMKLPARYVSGYILNQPPPGKEKLVGADASHAWLESYMPGLGWVGFDPTNGKRANLEFITVGWGRDFADVTPLRGVVLGSGEHELAVRVSVTT
ncbi:MAG: transglutaminase family protein [Gammaproteobacteria bacterium]|nr:transglutaminase family protein [Gammaproteobacteria bacterium]